jgi:hypothetical protein
VPSLADYTLEARLPEVLIRGRATPLRARVWSGGSQAIPTAATITVRDDSGTAVVDGASASIASDGTCSYTVGAGLVPTTYSPSNLWQVVWTLTLGGVVRDFVQDCTLARYWPTPRVREQDLVARHEWLPRMLRRSGNTLSTYVAGAWDTVVRRLIGTGTAPYRILNSGALYEHHLSLSLHRVFRDAAAATGGDGRYAELADQYAEEAEAEWRRLRLTIDTDDDGVASPGEEGRPTSGILMTGGVPYARRRLY